MAETSKISWTDATYNPWYGCRKVSPGCAYCYAERWASRAGKDFNAVMKAAPATFNAPEKWTKPRRIFTCSLSDFFIPEADKWRDGAWRVIQNTPQHTYLILTKRPERILDHLPRDWPWPNVHLGVSGENQFMLNVRLGQLLRIKAAGYFLSLEPLLGPILIGNLHDEWIRRKPFTVIVGGESGGPEHRRLIGEVCACGDWNEDHVKGGECRTCKSVGGTGGPGSQCKRFRFSHSEPKPDALSWVRSIRDECRAAGARFHFKQWGGARPESGGRELDGRIWDEHS